ncbi:LRR domain containing protein [Trema orientale]|uniref:LRR domain containing protein n=1 Tax=Trema orientale TaxID=63057 RepID=A0A2P5FS26_TREOI|nr:LRR domain containing protein [Trema orientale]
MPSQDLVRSSRSLESVSISVEKSLGTKSYDEVEDDDDDLYLTEPGFLNEWLPAIGGGLRSISISDFWSQSSWRRSDALALISSLCNNLLELELKNTWLSVDGLNPMPKLTNLTLEFLRLDDEDLNKVNECFPGLQVLNLIGVGGLKEPKIDLKHLKICHWTISNAPLSLTILAPSLVELKLECVKPRSLVVETPSLSNLHLIIEKAEEFKMKDFLCLKSLQLESWNLFSLMGKFGSSRTIKMLAVNVPKHTESIAPTLTFEGVFDSFPNLSSLKLGPGAWSEMEALFRSKGLEDMVGMNGLKEISAHLLIDEVDTTLLFISSILKRCSNLSNMAVLVHGEVGPRIASKFVSKCRADWPRIRWRWGFWKEGTEDSWVSDWT